MEKPYGKIFLQISNSHDCNLSHSGHPFFDRNSDAIRINLLGDRARGLWFFFIIKVTYFWLTKITGGFILRTFSMILIYFHRIFKKVWVSSSNFPGPGDDFFQRTVSDCTATGSTGFAESIHCTEHGTESGAETYLPWNSVYVFQDTGILDFILDFYEILIFNDIYIKTSSRGVIL